MCQWKNFENQLIFGDDMDSDKVGHFLDTLYALGHQFKYSSMWCSVKALRLTQLKGKKGKCAYSSLCIGNPSQSYGASPAIWHHTVLPATRHRWTCPALTPAMQAGTRFTYPGGMEGWVDLGVGYIPRWFTCPQTVTRPSSNHMIATRPGVEPTTSRSQS